MATSKLRELLLPKPFVGVALWTLAGISATALFFIFGMSQSEGARLTQPAVDSKSDSTEFANRAEGSPTTASTLSNPAQTMPAEFDVAPGADPPELPFSDDDDDLPYQLAWPDRTHEIVVQRTGMLPEVREGYRLGKQADPRYPGVTVEVTKEVFGPDDDLRIFVGKGDGYWGGAVELKTVRRELRILARVWSEDDVGPNPPPEWLDVSGQIRINSWLWPESKPIVIDYALTGVQGGMRQVIHDRVIIDF